MTTIVDLFCGAGGESAGIVAACQAADPVTRPLSTVVTKARHALVVPYYGASDARPVVEPLPTVTCRDRFGLLEGQPVTLDVTFRMLRPAELAAAQGFPGGYQFAGTWADQVRQIGNAVCPPVAQALAAAAIGGAV